MNKITKFLQESNAIEGIYDEDSLAQSVLAWKELAKEDKLTIKNILKAHKTITLNQSSPSPKEKGCFRRCQVWVGGREGMQWPQVPYYMSQWVKKANMDETWKEIKWSHIAFEECHPFADGNGRTGRLIMNYQCVKIGLPVRVIKEKDKFGYYKWFK